MRRATSAGARSGASAASRRSSSSTRARQEVALAAEQDDAGVDPLAALDPRDDAQDRVAELATAPARARSASSPNARGASSRRAQVVDVASRRGRRRRASRRARGDHALEQRARRRRGREPLVRLERSSRRVAAARARRSAGTARVALLGRLEPAVLEVERRAVVDQPQPPVPDEQVRVARRCGRRWCAARRARRRRRRARRRAGTRPAGVYGERAGQEVDADVEPGAGDDQLLDLGVRLGAPERAGRASTSTSSRHRQPERARELADDDLGDERQRALSRAAELDDVQPVVVGLDQPRQRPALAQRRHVAGRRDLGQGGRRLHRAHPSVVRRPA